MYYIYLLQCENNSIYTGIAIDVEKRFQEHLSGKGAKYTRANKPIKILYTEKCQDKSTAMKREIEIKRLSRVEKLKLVDIDF